MNYRIMQMNVFGDRRGKLVSLESCRNVPFEIRRVYYIFDTLPEEMRGCHAHKNLEQIIIAMDGSYDKFPLRFGVFLFFFKLFST